jgi:telomeric repeat-binding factor 2-interacting protein 1
VPLERDADYIISDPARKDAPAGSYSWKFIEDSLKKGVAQDVEQYLAGPPAGSVRSVGSRIPGKTTRTPFTPSDDLVLYKWVTDAVKKGMATKGNEIYEQLEMIVRGIFFIFLSFD